MPWGKTMLLVHRAVVKVIHITSHLRYEKRKDSSFQSNAAFFLRWIADVQDAFNGHLFFIPIDWFRKIEQSNAPYSPDQSVNGVFKML